MKNRDNECVEIHYHTSNKCDIESMREIINMNDELEIYIRRYPSISKVCYIGCSRGCSIMEYVCLDSVATECVNMCSFVLNVCNSMENEELMSIISPKRGRSIYLV